MSRYDELKRIEEAIKSCDMAELGWAKSYAKMRIDEARKTRPNSKTSKQTQKDWKKILGDVETAFASLDSSVYDEWISSLFDRDEAKGDWRFDIDYEPIDVPETLLCAFIIRLNSKLPELLGRYTDWQLAMGLDYIYNPCCSNYAFSIRDGDAPLKTRLAAIESMKNLYRDCFEIRCRPVLGHLSERGSEFNDFCYMLWDVTPINYCEGHKNRVAILDAVADVLEFALSMKNIACLESALHGLGHMVYKFPRAAEIIQSFINKADNIDSRILRYAEAAKTGYIQ